MTDRFSFQQLNQDSDLMPNPEFQISNEFNKEFQERSMDTAMVRPQKIDEPRQITQDLGLQAVSGNKPSGETTDRLTNIFENEAIVYKRRREAEEAKQAEQESTVENFENKTPAQILAETGQQSLVDELTKQGIDVNRLAKIRQQQRSQIDQNQSERVSSLINQGLSEKEAIYNVSMEGDVEEDIPGNKLFDGKYRISQQFNNYNPALYRGVTKDSRHKGLDVAVPKDTELRAPVSGRIEAKYDPKGYGLNVVIVDELGNSHRIAHLNKISAEALAAARQGKKIGAGQPIGLSGGKGKYAGNSTGYHTDISVRNSKGQFVNPLRLSVYKQLF